MEKKLLANAIAVATTAVAAAAFTVPVSAMDVYEDDDTKFGISGRLALRVVTGGDETEVEDSSSRIRFAFEQDLTRELTASARAEWGFDPVDTVSSDGFVFNRLGSVSLAHDSAGKITLGREWSASYDIAGWTDVLWVRGSDGLGTYEENETQRATDALIYRNSMAGFNISAQYGFYDTASDRDSNYQLAAFYELGDMGLSVGAAYSSTSSIVGEDEDATLLAAKYVNDMVYVAGAVGIFDDFDFAGDSMGYELVGFYYVPDSPFEIYGGWNSREADDTEAELSYYTLGAAMKVSNMVFAVEGLLDGTTKDAAGNDTGDDLVYFLARYNF